LTSSDAENRSSAPMHNIHDRDDARQFDDDNDGSNDNNSDADDDELGDEGEEGGNLGENQGENDSRKSYLIQDIKTLILL
jgi:hypothetical protein